MFMGLHPLSMRTSSANFADPIIISFVSLNIFIIRV